MFTGRSVSFQEEFKFFCLLCKVLNLILELGIVLFQVFSFVDKYVGLVYSSLSAFGRCHFISFSAKSAFFCLFWGKHFIFALLPGSCRSAGVGHEVSGWVDVGDHRLLFSSEALAGGGIPFWIIAGAAGCIIPAGVIFPFDSHASSCGINDYRVDNRRNKSTLGCLLTVVVTMDCQIKGSLQCSEGCGGEKVCTAAAGRIVWSHSSTERYGCNGCLAGRRIGHLRQDLRHSVFRVSIRGFSCSGDRTGFLLIHTSYTSTSIT